MSVSIEHEMLMTEIRCSICGYMQQDEETIQSFPCCLERRNRNDTVLKTSWKKNRVLVTQQDDQLHDFGCLNVGLINYLNQRERTPRR